MRAVWCRLAGRPRWLGWLLLLVWFLLLSLLSLLARSLVARAFLEGFTLDGGCTGGKRGEEENEGVGRVYFFSLRIASSCFGWFRVIRA